MARGVFSLSNYFRLSTGIITAAPLTIAGWAKTPASSNAQYMAGLYYTSAGSGTQLDGFGMRINATTQLISIVIGNGSSSVATPSTASAIAVDTWGHVAAKFISSTSRYVYLNGVASSQGTNSYTPTAPDALGIGAFIRENNSITLPCYDAVLAEFGFWNVALDDAEIAVLAKGVSPLLVRRQSLIAYYPMIRGDSSGNEPSPLNAAYSLTEQGTVAVASHPPMRYPYPRFPIIPVSSAPSGWTNIAKVNGVLSSSLAKVNGIAVADVSKINGLSV